jgi:hypothetical protein
MTEFASCCSVDMLFVKFVYAVSSGACSVSECSAHDCMQNNRQQSACAMLVLYYSSSRSVCVDNFKLLNFSVVQKFKLCNQVQACFASLRYIAV